MYSCIYSCYLYLNLRIPPSSQKPLKNNEGTKIFVTNRGMKVFVTNIGTKVVVTNKGFCDKWTLDFGMSQSSHSGPKGPKLERGAHSPEFLVD